jgi:hypothetical protein
MRYAYPLAAKDTFTYSHRIRDYRKLSNEEKKILVNNFKEFYKYVFWWLGHPHPTRDQLYMAKFTSEKVFTKEPAMLQAQRGLAKSLTVQILSSWLLLRNKNEIISVISATSARAESFITFVCRLFGLVPLLKHLEPRGNDRRSSRKIDVHGRMINDSPSLSAFGVTSAKTGSRSSFLIYDDVEIPENSNTPSKREKLLDGVRDSANLGIAGVYREMAICTPQSSESVYNVLVEEDGFSRTIIPAEYPEDMSVYEGDLAKHISRICKKYPSRIGTATDKRNNMQHLMSQKPKGKARYKLHYMLDTMMTDAERYPLKLNDLIVMDLDDKKAPIDIFYSSANKDTLYDIKNSGLRGDNLHSPSFVSEETKEYEGIAMFVDPSGRGADETGWCVTANLAGKIFLLDFGGIKGGYDIQSLEYLANVAKRFQVQLIQVESNFGDGSFAELLKPVVSRIYKKAYREKELKDERGVFIEDVRAFTQKEKRIIETIEPVLMQHRLIVNKSSLIKDAEKPNQEYRFTYQMTHLTMEANSLSHDDIIDVVEMGVSYWQQVLAKDEQEELNKYKEEQEDLEIQRFLEEMCEVSPSNNIMDNY